MSEQKTLKDSLIAAFGLLKEQNAMLYTMWCDLSALKKLIWELDFSHSARYAELFASELENKTQEIADSSKVYDELISALKTETRWIN